MKRYRIDEHRTSLVAHNDDNMPPDGGEELIDLVIAAHDERVAANAANLHATADGIETVVEEERIILKAEKEIVLQCGDASITLTRAGKIIIRGAYVSSRSTGVNRIQGGSVEIN